jgi:two-component system alkaline phosphatase synthesis response regulator PhoP
VICLVEDEADIRELVIYTLQNTGFEARGFANGRDFWQAVENGGKPPSLVLLDIMLPDEDGLAILKRLRAADPELPVMMLTAKGTEYDKVRGLDAGADDYLAKPFGMMELVARVKSLLRRRPSAETNEYEIDGLSASLSVSLPRRRVAVDGEEVSLTLKEFDLLAFLLKNAGIVLTRNQILSAVWDYDFEGETRTVDTHILTLRGKLGPCSGVIQTVRGVGYRVGGLKVGDQK